MAVTLQRGNAMLCRSSGARCGHHDAGASRAASPRWSVGTINLGAVNHPHETDYATLNALRWLDGDNSIYAGFCNLRTITETNDINIATIAGIAMKTIFLGSRTVVFSIRVMAAPASPVSTPTIALSMITSWRL